jgi:hypothetical protein
MLIEAPDTFQKPLPAKYLMNTRNAASEAMRWIKESRIRVGDLLSKRKHLDRNLCRTEFCLL